MIIDVRYSIEDNTQIKVAPQDWTLPQPCNTWHQDEVDAWIAEGNTITPYDPNYGVTNDQLKEINYRYNSDYADTVISSAESNPTIGTNLDERGTAKENDRRNNRAKGKAKVTDADDTLSDYIDSCYDILDQADDTVENLTREELINWDATSVVYPEWIAPVAT